jgi:hypothetical protein
VRAAGVTATSANATGKHARQFLDKRTSVWKDSPLSPQACMQPISEVESNNAAAACGGDDSVGMTATAASTSAASKPSEGPHAGSGDDTAVVGGPAPDGNPVVVLLCYTPPEAAATLQIDGARSKEVKELYHFRNYHEVRCGPSPLPHRRCHAKPPRL